MSPGFDCTILMTFIFAIGIPYALLVSLYYYISKKDGETLNKDSIQSDLGMTIAWFAIGIIIAFCISHTKFSSAVEAHYEFELYMERCLMENTDYSYQKCRTLYSYSEDY